MTAETLSALRSLPHARLQLIISGARAKSIGLASGDIPAAMETDPKSLSLARNQMAPLRSLSTTKTLPNVVVKPACNTATTIVKLAKYASLLPAMLLVRGDEAMLSSHLLAHWQTLSLDDIKRYIDSPLIDIIQTAQASLPLEINEKNTILSFRSAHATNVHLALIIGDIAEQS